MVNDYMLDKVLGNNTKIFVGTDDKLPDYVTLTLFNKGLDCSRMGGGKEKPSSKSVTQILQ